MGDFKRISTNNQTEAVLTLAYVYARTCTQCMYARIQTVGL